MRTDPCRISHGEKQRMIANAAYFRAIQKGFGNTDPVEDWLAAEAEIEKSLQNDCRQGLPFTKNTQNHHAGLLDAVTGWMYRVTTRKTFGARRRMG